MPVSTRSANLLTRHPRRSTAAPAIQIRNLGEALKDGPSIFGTDTPVMRDLEHLVSQARADDICSLW